MAMPQERLGQALAPYRKNCFFTCKTKGRMKDDSRKQLEESPRLLKTDHVDLYQFHGVTKMTDLDKVLGPGGAMETMEAAKQEGKIRHIGFSVHSAETALAAMDRYNADSEACAGKGMDILAPKAMAKTVWSDDQEQSNPEPKCWYQPAAFPDEASLGLRWTLGHPVTAALPPGTRDISVSRWTWRRTTSPSTGMRNRHSWLAQSAWSRSPVSEMTYSVASNRGVKQSAVKGSEDDGISAISGSA